MLNFIVTPFMVYRHTGNEKAMKAHLTFRDLTPKF